MKRNLLVMLLLCVTAAFIYGQNDTVRHVIFTEWRGDAETQAYIEITNVGDSAVDLSRFSTNSMTPWHTRLNQASAPEMTMRLNGILEPGETFLMVTISEQLANFEQWNQGQMTKPGLIERADLKIYRFEPGIEVRQGVHDSISPDYRVMWLWNGSYASELWYNFDDGIRDSVLVDNVNMLLENIGEYPFCDLYPEFVDVHHVAGIFSATDDYILVRKANIKEGTPWDGWDKARGVDLEDSEWIPLPVNGGTNPGGAIFNTVGNHGDFQLDYSTSTYNLDEANKVITVPWGTQRGDSILLDDGAISLGIGNAWQYVLNGVHEDSALTICATGDTLRFFAAGNERYQADFRIEVSEPTDDMVYVFPAVHINLDEDSEYYMSYEEGTYIPYFVTEDNPVIDTIGSVPFATRVDTLMAYLTVPPNATTSFVWVDSVERADLKDGDKLVVTGGNETSTKEYYISIDEYEASDNAKLASITWPDKPGFVEGWFTDDTIPGFSPTRLIYQLTLPLGTTNIPALVTKTQNLNATVTVDKAFSLKGSVADRTTIITVMAEDDSTELQYTIIFNVEKDLSNLQVFDADALITEIGEQTSWNNGYIEVTNPGNVDLDLSEYMFISGSAIDPVSAIAWHGAQPDSGGFTSRYKKYVPGYRFTDNVTEWIASPAILIPDATVDPLLAGGESFLMVSGSNGGGYSERLDPELFDRADIFFHSVAGHENQWGMLFNDWNTVSHIWRNNIIYMYKIMNDSVLDGTKGAVDPADFDLVDAFGSTDGSVWTVGGRFVYTDSWSIKRKPHIYQGSHSLSELVAAMGTTPEDGEWTATVHADMGLSYPQDHYALRDGAGSHAFDAITGYMSTISSMLYNVSPGYISDQTITGDVSGTVDELLAMIIKSDQGQDLSLHSNVDGSVKAGTDAIAVNDTLVVTSADGTNVTKYVLVNAPLSDDALLTSDTYTIEVNGETGTIRGMDFGVTIASVVDNVVVPDLGTMNIVNGMGELISLKVLDFDTVYRETLVGDDVYFEVIAEDHKTIITYHLMPAVSASDAFVISSVYMVEQKFHKIFGIPFGTAVPALLKNVIPASGAAVSVVDRVGQTRMAGVIAYDDMLKVVSLDGTVTVMYHLEFQDETITLANAAPNVVLANATINVAVDVSFNVSVTATDDGIPGPLTYAWSVSAGEAGNVAFTAADQAGTGVTISAAGSYTLQIDVSDGDLTTSESVEVTVNPTGIEESGMGSMKLYPNPVNDNLSIELSGLRGGAATLKIYSITGVALYHAELHQLRSEIDLGMFDQGIYLVSVSAGDQTLLQRIQVVK